MNPQSFRATVDAAVADLTAHGYDSQARVDDWVRRITAAAAREMTPAPALDTALRSALSTAWKRVAEPVAISRAGPERYTLARLSPQLRGELERRLAISRNLIKLNREQAMAKTVQRFSGWASSVPEGGSDVVDKRTESKAIREPLKSLPFQERRVMIDQGHKMVSTLNEIVAVDQGAIAAIWRSKWRQPGYNYRPDHKERDEQVYTIRGNWALANGTMRVGPAGYTDQITQPAEEVFCQCNYQYLYSVRALPEGMRGRNYKAAA